MKKLELAPINPITRSERGNGTHEYQYCSFGPRPIDGYGKGAAITVLCRFDDSCKNGHDTFSITADVRVPGRRDIEAGGCMHDEIAKAFPELAYLIPWHLCSTDGPMHYIANTVYLAGDRNRVVGEGKARDLDAARRSANWPEATDEQLCSEPEVLRQMLLHRLPKLQSDFREAMESVGFTWLEKPEVACT